MLINYVKQLAIMQNVDEVFEINYKNCPTKKL